MNSTLPGRAQFVIIGGGAVGCGVAYSLAEAGCKDILLLERAGDLGQVTTSQGAGLCGQPRDSVERIKLAMRSVATFGWLHDSRLRGESLRRCGRQNGGPLCDFRFG